MTTSAVLRIVRMVTAGTFLAWVGFASNQCQAQDAEGIAFFESKVRPILVQRCYECHSGTKTSGNLALDRRIGWERGGDSGPSIVPGNTADSLLIQAIERKDQSTAMPPKESLTSDEVRILKEWVQRGAPDPRTDSAKLGGMSLEQAKSWWAFQPIVEPILPPVDQINSEANVSSGNRSPIDRFVDQKIVAMGIAKSPSADRLTLIRRAAYDLTGLPPTMNDVTAFLQDDSTSAYERLIDRLLESPEYGAQWGRHWLDVVRYADTAGENTDRPLPQIWRYRNWVIQSFNRDMPFDEFTKLQIGGDLFRAKSTGDAYSEGLIATGYLACARRFGHDADKDMHLTYEDTIDNLGKAFLGLTLSCARCHDHKYDPLTMKDYYAMYGILSSSRYSFSGCEAKGQPRDLVPLLSQRDMEERQRPWQSVIDECNRGIAAVDSKIEAIENGLNSRIAAGSLLEEGEISESGAVDLFSQSMGKKSVDVKAGDLLLFVIGPNGNHGADSTRIDISITQESEAGSRWSTNDLLDSFLRGNPWKEESGATPVWAFLDLQSRARFLSQSADRLNDKVELQAWRNEDTPSAFVNRSESPISVWTNLPARSFFVHPGPNGPVAVAWRSPESTNVSVECKIADAHPGGPNGVTYRVLHVPGDPETDNFEVIQNLIEQRLHLIKDRDQRAGPKPESPLAFTVIDGEASDARMQLRGDPEKPGDAVGRRWIEALGGQEIQNKNESGRRELAEWVAYHPLTTRTIVNRVWQWHFGQGLVRSSNDFGSRGEMPTHPELLEWLSAKFIEDGRQFKALHRRIMLSEAYQRSSLCDVNQLRVDPNNQWLAHFTRRRLSAEEIRDSFLAAGGNLELGTSEGHPFPPENSWTYTQHAPFAATYDNNRRSVYQMVQRQRRHPFLALFDGADPNASSPIRQTTTVPTQSLYFMNDAFLHDQASRLVGRVVGLESLEKQISMMHQIAYQRVPTGKELSMLVSFMDRYPAESHERLIAVARILFASNEFLHVD